MYRQTSADSVRTEGRGHSSGSTATGHSEIQPTHRGSTVTRILNVAALHADGLVQIRIDGLTRTSYCVECA